MGSVRMLDCGSLQGPSVDLLLIVFFVTIIGKRMCLPIGTATVGALLQGPGSCEAWSFDAAAPLERGTVEYGWDIYLLCSVSPTASGRQSSHPEQPSPAAGWQQIIHVAWVGLGKWKMPWRRSLACGWADSPPPPPLSRGVNASRSPYSSREPASGSFSTSRSWRGHSCCRFCSRTRIPSNTQGFCSTAGF